MILATEALKRKVWLYTFERELKIMEVMLTKW